MNRAERLAEAVERLISVILRQRRALGDVEPSPLSTTQSLALSAIARAGRLRLGALADALGTTDATASRTVDALEAQGFAERAADPDDRRGVVVAVTPAGRRARQQRRDRFVAMANELLDGLEPADQQRLVQLLTGLEELLASAERAPVDLDIRTPL